MPDVSDYELFKTTDQNAPSRRSLGLWIAVVLILGAALVTLLVLVWQRRTTPAPTTTAHTEAPPRPARPLGGDAEPIALPPLNETDAIVRELVQKASSHPRLAAWLATDDLIRDFTIGVANVAQGESATRQLTVLRPSSSFQVIQRGNDLAIDPRSYKRYDGIAAAAQSIDPAAIARVYATLKPRIEEAARELGDASFDRTLERAIVQLLNTPIPNDPILVQTKGIGYSFVDPKLEALTNGQKHLLRTGPQNARIIKQSLRNIATALGIPEERLPNPGR
ncbi:MAG TPA: DUF3014 domain-containing protein [Vicinamibacterales bacterium]|nr:DUF3014 domain-containing protein [Vicinamibacterales bacterium]